MLFDLLNCAQNTEYKGLKKNVWNFYKLFAMVEISFFITRSRQLQPLGHVQVGGCRWSRAPEVRLLRQPLVGEHLRAEVNIFAKAKDSCLNFFSRYFNKFSFILDQK